MVLCTIEHMRKTDVCDLVNSSPIFFLECPGGLGKEEQTDPGHLKLPDGLCVCVCVFFFNTLLVSCGSRELQTSKGKC